MIERLRHSWKQSRFLRGVAVLAGSTAIGQALAVVVSPIITRIYEPADFGALAVYAAVLAILSVTVSWRYEVAIPLPERAQSTHSSARNPLPAVADSASSLSPRSP